MKNSTLVAKFEPVQDKTYNKICATRKKTQISLCQWMARVLVYLSLDSMKAVEGTCDQRRLSTDNADTQADLSLRWSYKFLCRFLFRALAQIIEPQIQLIVNEH